MQKRKRDAPRTKNAESDVQALLQGITAGKAMLVVEKGGKIFTQGDSSDAIFFIESGKVKISVVSTGGKEAVLAILDAQAFFGEGSLVAQSLRISTATALVRTTLLRVETQAMLRGLAKQPSLSERFIASLLVRNISLEEDLCDQLFNHSEKRLARVLLKLARMGQHDTLQDTGIPMLSHETLAEMVGTTRARITHFMNKFRKLGLIEYNGELIVRPELLTDVVLHD